MTKAIQEELVNKSLGIFQWIVLVVPRVLQLYKRGQPLAVIRRSIQATPSALSELYKALLERNGDEDLPHSLHSMQWICFAMRPLSLEELRFATIVDENTSYRSISECQEAEEYATTDEEMEKRVLNLSRGLAEVRKHERNQVVQFIHQSVNDFLVRSGLQILDKSENNIVSRAHFRLSRSCIRYIAML